jgi:hypothetical protein
MNYARVPMLLAACGLALPAAALAQRARPEGASRAQLSQRTLDSGWVEATGGDAARPIFSAVVRAPGAGSVRLSFGATPLAGNTETQSAAYIRLTSLLDGHTQVLNADHLRQWSSKSAYFNGDAVRVELIAAPGTGRSRVVVDSIIPAGTGQTGDSLCSADDRLLSTDGRVGRLMPSGCTAFIINDSARCLLSAGQCAPSAGSVVQFNVPLSTAAGAVVHPPPRDQYPVDPASVQMSSVSAGSDWSYFGVFPNSGTGMSPGFAQGPGFTLASAPPLPPYAVAIKGYGTVTLPISLTWSQVQKIASGPLVSLNGSLIGHQADTTLGNAGSPIELASSGQVIGIHTGDGCVQAGGVEFNVGTAVQAPGLQAALASPAGLCATSTGAVEPPIFVGTDPAGRIMTLSRTTGGFGTVGTTGVGGVFAGLAYDRGRARFYASRFNPQGPDELYTIQPSTGAATLVGNIAGAADITGLAFDPNTDTLYGIDQSTGSLHRISFVTGAASPVGAASNPNIGALDFDPTTSTLYGLEDHPTLGTRLVRLSTATGQMTVVGPLGPGIVDCDGLAYCVQDRTLYTVSQSTGQSLRINAATGAATAIGAAGALAGPSFGMASRDDCSAPCIPSSPSPMISQFEIPIQASLYWNGCPNQKIYIIDNVPHHLFDVLTATAQSTLIGPAAPTSTVAGMTWDGGALTAIDLSTGNLFSINHETGQATLRGITGITGWQGLASDPTEWGQLYGITQNNSLYRLTPTGTPTIVAAAVGTLITALEFDAGGRLWGIEFATGRILQINKATGQLTHVCTTMAGFQGLDFDDEGRPYGHNSATGSLYTIDIASGLATLRGSTGTSSVKAVAFARALDSGGGTWQPPGGGGLTLQGAGGLYDPADLTTTTPITIDAGKVIDGANHGLRQGQRAVAGQIVPEHLAPSSPGPSGRESDATCGGTLINFDAAYAPCGFGMTTRLTTQYLDQGVIFEGSGIDGGAVLNQCAGFGVSGHSGQNLLAFNTASRLADGGTPQGPQTLRFTTPVSSVQVLAGSATSTGTITLRAYKGEQLVATRVASLTTTMAPLLVVASGITRAVITSTAPSFVVDDLCFVQSCPTLYDIYFGQTNPPPLVEADTPNVFFRPAQPMENTSLYYWRVVAKNCCGQTVGPLWRFTTQCYPNCDESTIPPVLNVQDFTCFLQRYAAGDTYANCDNGSVAPTLNVADFTCFLQRYAEGCPQ